MGDSGLSLVGELARAVGRAHTRRAVGLRVSEVLREHVRFRGLVLGWSQPDLARVETVRVVAVEDLLDVSEGQETIQGTFPDRTTVRPGTRGECELVLPLDAGEELRAYAIIVMAGRSTGILGRE